MDVFYLRVSDRHTEGFLDPNLHCSWLEFKAAVERREAEGADPFWALDVSANALVRACANTILSAGATTVQIFSPPLNRWIIFPVQPSNLLDRALSKGYPIKVFLTRFNHGRKSKKWFLVFVVARQTKGTGKDPYSQKFRGQRVSLEPLSIDNPIYVDDGKILQRAYVLITTPPSASPLPKKKTDLPLPSTPPEYMKYDTSIKEEHK